MLSHPRRNGLDQAKGVYLIKDLAQVTGISIDTIKYYCKLGLVKEESRSLGTNFRYFGDTAAEALRKIRAMRTQGLSLKEIGAVLRGETAA